MSGRHNPKLTTNSYVIFLLTKISLLYFPRHNRQFRYEERDGQGHVKGHYGYYDESGKLQVFNYAAHPELGFQSEQTDSNVDNGENED